MTTESRLPEWPTESWPTKDDAMVAAVSDSEPGDEIVGHQAGCARKHDEPCDCSPDVVIVMDGKA